MSELPALFTGQASTESRTVVSQSPDPTSVEFESAFRDLLDEALKPENRKLLIVVDNLDRVEPSDALSIWSTLQTFLGHKEYQRPDWIDRLWILIPYDDNAILRLWDGSGPNANSKLATSFLDKTFQLRFRVPPLLLSNMRDDAFSLSEGEVTGARRVDGRNDLWEITVEPDDDSDVGITLPANRSCTTTGAICTREDSPRQLTNSPTATVTGPAEAPPINTSAAGAPTISGTPQVEQTLTADTSSITDEDGLTNVSYGYQWIAGGTDIEGATGSTYTLTASEQGQTIQVRVTFTDDADNEETLTSAATVEVTAAPAPLTASLADSRFQSARHNGADDRPQVIVAFSMAVASFEKTTPSVSLIGAAVRSVRQHQEDGLENAWIFFLDSDGDGDIVFSLVTGRPCDSGGICTEDGGMLSEGVQVTLPGPEEEAGDDQQTPQSPPAKPTGLTATVNADGHIVLSWTAPNDDSITGYQILRRLPSEGESALLVYVADTESTATTFTDTGVTAGVTHVYRVKAINAAGLSGWSNYVNPTP